MEKVQWSLKHLQVLLYSIAPISYLYLIKKYCQEKKFIISLLPPFLPASLPPSLPSCLPGSHPLSLAPFLAATGGGRWKVHAYNVVALACNCCGIVNWKHKVALKFRKHAMNRALVKTYICNRSNVAIIGCHIEHCTFSNTARNIRQFQKQLKRHKANIEYSPRLLASASMS